MADGARQIFLAATGQNRGKTTASLGLFAAFTERGLKTAFMKPVGQRWIMLNGAPADEDAALMREVFDLPDPTHLLSPVQIPRGFTRRVIEGEVVEDFSARILDAQGEMAKGRDLLLLEGTGHAGVGAVIGLSNADVAALLGAPVIIVSEGGIGRPIDEIVLNAALFAARGVEVAGAIVNKVNLVHEYNNTRYTNLTCKKDVLFRLWHWTVCCGNHKNCTVHLGSTSNHIFNVVSVTWTVNVRVVTRSCLILYVCSVDGDTSFFFFRCTVDFIVLLCLSETFFRKNLGNGSS